MKSTALLPTRIDQETPAHGGMPGFATKLSRRLLILVSFPFLISVGQAAVPAIQDPAEIYPLAIELINNTNVAIQIEATDNPTSYGATALPPGLSLNTQTGLITGEATNQGFLYLPVTLSATNADGTGLLDVEFYVYQREPASIVTSDNRLEEAMDTVIAPFTQSPYNKPTDFFYLLAASPSIGGGYDSDLIRNNKTSDNSITGVQTYVRGPAEVSFRWRSIIEPFFDDFDFRIDGVLVATLDGTNPWATVEFSLSPGLHRLEWLFVKDYNDAAGGNNACFLDRLQITGYPVWADDYGLSPFSSGFNVDEEGDGNSLLLEYGLKLRPDRHEMVAPIMTFEPDGRAVLEIGKNKDAIGVTVDIEKSSLLTPGSWVPVPETVTDSSRTLIKRENTPQTEGNYRVKVTSP